MCFAPQRRALFRHLNFQKWSERDVFLTFSLANVLRATTAWTFSTSQLPKVVRTWCVLCILTSKCASRHNGVHFLDISTSKSGPNLVCFVHFEIETCFAPQRHALFQHRNFQKWSEREVLLPFSLANVLRATTAPLFQHLNFQKWSEPGVFCTFWLRNVSTLWSHTSLEKHGKTQCFATFLPFRAPASSCFWLFLFSDLLSSSLLSSTLLFSLTLPISAFHLSILSEVWLRNFLRLYMSHTTPILSTYFNMVHDDSWCSCLNMLKTQVWNRQINLHAPLQASGHRRSGPSALPTAVELLSCVPCSHYVALRREAIRCCYVLLCVAVGIRNTKRFVTWFLS